MILWSFSWLGRLHPPGTINRPMRERPNYPSKAMFTHTCALRVVQMFLLLRVTNPSGGLKIKRTSFIMLRQVLPDSPRNYFCVRGPPIITNTVIYETLERQHPCLFPCYRIGFGGSPVHPIIMARVLEQISIETLMHPGVVSTRLLSTSLVSRWITKNKKWSREARKDVHY